MKKNFKKIFLLLTIIATIVLYFSLSAAAERERYTGKCGDNVYWSLILDCNELVISGSGAMYCHGHDYGDVDDDYVELVNKHYGYEIFASDISSIVIKNGVTTIGCSNLRDFRNLSRISISDSVTTICDSAFSSSDKLKNVYYTGSASQWKKITIGSNNEYLKSATIHYNSCLHEDSKGGIVDLGDLYCDICNEYLGVTYITGKCGDNAIYEWYKDGNKLVISGSGSTWDYSDDWGHFSRFDIKSVVIKKGITTIGASMFSEQGSIESVTISEGVTKIDYSAFYSCKSLTTITIPVSMTKIAGDAFLFSDNLTDVYYAGSKAQWKKIYISSLETGLERATIHCSGCSTTATPEQKPTCTAVGYTAGKYCYECKEWHSGHKKIAKIAHSYTKYTYNKDATVWSDGTKTALCDYGCGNKKTVTAKGTLLPLGDPSNLTATQTTTSITLSWNKGKNATGYSLYYKAPGDITWKECVYYTTKTTYTFKNLSSGTLYSFAVTSVAKGSSYIVGNAIVRTISTATKTEKPTSVTATQNASTIKLIWDKCSGATGYRIFYKSGSSWKVAVSSTTATKHTFKNLKAGTKFAFAIRPYIKTGSGIVWSDYTPFITSTKPAAPTVKATSPSQGKITVKWSTVKCVDAYQVYYKTNDGSYKLYKNYSKAGTINFSNLKSGAKFTFAIRGAIKTSDGWIFGSFKPVSVTVK